MAAVPRPRRTPQQASRNASLTDGSIGLFPPGPDPGGYYTFECRIGQHDRCSEHVEREPDPACPQVVYQVCACDCRPVASDDGSDR